MDSIESNYVESVIQDVESRLLIARELARTYSLSEVDERLSWALDFLRAGLVKLTEATE